MTAYSFDGTDDYISASDVTEVSTTATYTITFWIRKRSNGGVPLGVVTDSNDRFSTQIESDGRLSFGNYDGSSWLGSRSTGSLDNYTWYHLAFVYESGSSTLYLDGGSVSDGGEAPFASSTTGTTIGSATDGNDQVNASMADVRIYNRALSESEITTLYEWGSEDYTTPSLSDGTDSGAVSRYEFEGNVQDSWGTNDGTDNTSAGFSSDAIQGQAKSFDGTDDYVSLPLSKPDNNYSISFWVNYDSGSADAFGSIISTRNEDGSGDHIDYQVDSATNPQLEFIHDDGTDRAALTTEIDNLLWFHSTAVVTTSTATLYTNGAKIDSASISNFSDGTNFQVGRRPAGDNHIAGELDDLRIYDRALSQPEVFELYQWGARGRDMRPMLVKQ